MSLFTRTVNAPDSYKQESTGRGVLLDKVYIGFVKEVDDRQRMGRLKVWIPELSNDPTDPSTWVVVNYCSPFAGATSFYNNNNGTEWTDTQRSYGMWFVPPDLENEVVVAFINGDSSRGVWLGCLYQQNMNHMVPGIPGQNSTADLPVVEYNKKLNNVNINKPNRPVYAPLADQLIKQGLNQDIVRGVTDSGARRNDPENRVYGILTPGGNQFVFDDSPSNSFIRLRTQSGSQILINDTVGCIYINSVDGKNWVSLDATGKIDIYAYDDISIRTQGSLNLRADIDVNIEAGRDINMKAVGRELISAQVRNPESAEVPAIPQLGPIVVIGDSIAVGTASKIQNALSSAGMNDNSTQIYEKISTQADIKNVTNTVLSVGTNDTDQVVLASNLEKIRNYLGDSNFVWIVPYSKESAATVTTFATTKGDKTVLLSQYPTTDQIHPRDYNLVANDVQAKCIADPNSTDTIFPAKSVNGMVDITTRDGKTVKYKPGGVKTLDEAKAEAVKYKSMADNARPENYKPQELTTIYAFEAAANAEVKRLEGGTVDKPTENAIKENTTSTRLTPATATSTTAVSATTSENWLAIAKPFIKKEEGKKAATKAYQDPPGKNTYSIGYGHWIGNNIKSGQTLINCGPGVEPVRIQGASGKDTTCTVEQAEGMFNVDIIALGAAVAQRQLGGTWDLLTANQKAAVVSYTYNVGNIYQPVGKGFKDHVYRKNTDAAAATIQTSALTWNGGPPNALAGRRKREAELFKGNAVDAATGPNTDLPDGYPQTADETNATAVGTPMSSSDSNIEGGYIKIQSKNNMHFLSGQHLFMTSAGDYHRLAGNNIFDSSIADVNVVAGKSVYTSTGGQFHVGSGATINLNGARIDLNGVAPSPGTSAAQAVGPTTQKQTDAVINSVGNVTAILTDTILPHLPFHEPYDNHGGRHFENIRDATSIDNNNGLRDGEIIKNSEVPLDVYGKPRSDMGTGIYIGVSYNIKDSPLYRYTGTLEESIFSNSSSLQLSVAGRQFIVARENGSYRPIQVGTPPKLEIGYGHSLTPEEIDSDSIVIKGETKTLTRPLTQQEINELFDQDMEKVLTWMRPLIKISVSQTQFDMLASLAFNIGESNFSSSPAIKELNGNNLQRVPNNWMKHVKTASGQILPGLIFRRRAEVVLFMQGPANDKPTGESTSIPT